MFDALILPVPLYHQDFFAQMRVTGIPSSFIHMNFEIILSKTRQVSSLHTVRLFYEKTRQNKTKSACLAWICYPALPLIRKFWLAKILAWNDIV